MGTLNWRGGLFRLWIVCSLFWAGLSGWIVFDRYATAQSRASQVLSTLSTDQLKALLDKTPPDERGMFDDLLPFSQSGLREFTILALPPVIGSFIVGAALLWIGAGFKRR